MILESVKSGAFSLLPLHLMPLTKQGDELIHAVTEGGRDETEPIGLRFDEFWIDTGTFDCFLEVFLSSKHPEVQGADTFHRAFYQLGVVFPDGALINLGNDLDLIIKDCGADEVRYALKAKLLPTLLEAFFLHSGETDVMKISPSLVIISLHKSENLKGDYL